MHGRRVAYYIFTDDEGIVPEQPASNGGGSLDLASLEMSPLRFGRMFGKTSPPAPAGGDDDPMVKKFEELGKLMNADAHAPQVAGGNDSDVPAGYTYLGQFIAHEITHDSTGDMVASKLTSDPKNLSTPEIDLDSLYGGDGMPEEKRRKLFEEDGVHLKVEKTLKANGLQEWFPNDLPRWEDPKDGDGRRRALTGDNRNDENLALAQTHIAFIHFHNRVVDAIWAEDEDLTATQVFERAREQVIRHFQWVILYDFLPKIIRADVLDCVMRHGLRWFKGDGKDGVFMPLEFSAAAFRIGHTMVRAVYEWSPYHRTTSKLAPGPAQLPELFRQTGSIKKEFSDFGDDLNLKSDWVIDWRHFYDFDELIASGDVVAVRDHNKAAKLDTNFDMHLNGIPGFTDDKIKEAQSAITVRNLLRGYYLGLPTGEEVADWIGETPLKPEEVWAGPHKGLLDDPDFRGKTPLWFYVLKEAELRGFSDPYAEKFPGNRLGPVGSRIVAETLVGLVKHSRPSILGDKPWYPKYGRGEGENAVFGMIDLLKFAGVVDPIADYLRKRGYVNTGEG